MISISWYLCPCGSLLTLHQDWFVGPIEFEGTDVTFEIRFYEDDGLCLKCSHSFCLPWITLSGRSKPPCCEDTQAVLWRSEKVRNWSLWPKAGEELNSAKNHKLAFKAEHPDLTKPWDDCNPCSYIFKNYCRGKIHTTEDFLILRVQFTGTEYFHIVEQPWPPTICRTLFIFPNWNSCTHYTITPHDLLPQFLVHTILHCLCESDYSKDLMLVESYCICSSTPEFFHLAQCPQGSSML